MKLLLDTHLLLWAAGEPKRLSARVRSRLNDSTNELVFSAVSLWEIAIKSTLGRVDFSVDPRTLRRDLLDHGYVELAISSAHAAATAGLPPIHKDPFDRMLAAQALVDGITLLTTDPVVAQYPVPVEKI